jgi:hypothetical protein
MQQSDLPNPRPECNMPPTPSEARDSIGLPAWEQLIQVALFLIVFVLVFMRGRPWASLA